MSLTVVTKPTQTALTTVTRAKQMLGFPLTQDLAMQMAIDQASARIAAFCNRTFGEQTVRQTEQFYGLTRSNMVQGISLALDPVSKVNSVLSGGVLVDPSLYEYDECDLSLYSLYAGGRQCWSASSLVIEYVAGWTLPNDKPESTWTLPADIERACILLAGASISLAGRDPMVRSERVEGVGSTDYYVQGANASLPHPEAEAILLNYRRIILA